MLNQSQLKQGLQIFKWLSEADQLTWTEREKIAVSDIIECFQANFEPEDILAKENPKLINEFKDAKIRSYLLHASILFSAINGIPTEEKYKRVKEIAKELGEDSANLEILALLVKGKLLRLRRKLMSQFWAVKKLKVQIQVEGPKAIFIFISSNFFKIYKKKSLAAKYQALDSYPSGSLGKEYANYIHKNNFSFPGEKGAASEIITFHDLSHILSGYNTSPNEEVLAASFMAGYMRNDECNILMFVLLQFHLGIRVTPGAKAEQGHFNVKAVLCALQRGASMNLDLTDGWDYWTVMGEQVEKLRNLYNIPSMKEAQRQLSTFVTD
jgi:hypothetical protein